MKDYHYTMMHVCFGRPSMIRGFNNHNLSHNSLKDGALEQLSLKLK